VVALSRHIGTALVKKWEACAAGAITRAATLRSAQGVVDQLTAWKRDASSLAVPHVQFLLDRLSRLQ